MILNLAFVVFYSAFHSVHGYEATSLRGRALQDTQAPAPADDVNASLRQNQANTRIIDGSVAIEDRFSYAVSLQNSDSQHVCGGSLIAKDVVLTAAHCEMGGLNSLVIGRHNLNDSDGEEISLKKVLPHPEYTGATTIENDFMLVFLEGTPTADNVIQVKLNSDSLVPSLGQDMTVMGWGDTDPRHDILTVGEFSTPSEVLLNIDVGYLSNEECGSMWDGGFLGFGGDFQWFWEVDITDSMMCAKRSNGQGTCQGDSGGPLIIRGADGASDLQVGVVSFGSLSGCADTDKPDVYARVSNAYEWIQSEVCKGSTYASEAGFDCSGNTPTLDDDDTFDFVLDLFDGT